MIGTRRFPQAARRRGILIIGPSRGEQLLPLRRLIEIPVIVHKKGPNKAVAREAACGVPLR